MISYQRTKCLDESAEITYANMRTYYEQYSVDWKQSQILEKIQSLENWDILDSGNVVGVIRLFFDDDGCYLRDLQVTQESQNKGFGRLGLKEAERLALKYDARKLRLRVFKISPAFRLYDRIGFEISHEDERFYYMEKELN